MAGLSSAQEIMVRLYLLGGPQYRAEMEKAGLVTKELTGATTKLGAAMNTTNKRSFIQNQLLFTARRGMFYTTLGAIALTGEIIKMGFAYDNAMQSASVALGQVIRPQKLLQGELQQLFLIAAKTPFQVKDITVAFRQMFIAFKPFHVGLGTLNQTILAITNNLSATGKVTPASLNRVSTALAHMANVGHLTGQAVLQLARDGLQLQPALQKELHLTSDQLANIGKAGIPARDVLMALIKYSQSTPGIANAAFRQANLTLAGSATSLKDYISQAAGGALGGPGGTGGIFGYIQKQIVGINKELGKMSAGGKAVTLTDIAMAMDKQLTPQTHIILNLFIAFSTAIHTVGFMLGALFKTIQLILRPLDLLASLFGANHFAAKALGVALGVMLTVVITGTTIWGAYRVAVDAAKLAQYGLGRAIAATTTLQKAQDILMGGGSGAGLIAKWRKWATLEKTVNRVPVWKQPMATTFGRGSYEKDFANTGIFARASRGILGKGGLKEGMKSLGSAMKGIIPLFASLIVESYAFFVANLWWFIFVLAIIAVIAALVLLYRKWQWFHDAVNNTARFVKKYWEIFMLGVPIIGWMIVALTEVIRHWNTFENVIMSVVDAIKSLIDWIKKIPSKIPGWNWISKLVTVPAHALGAAGGAIGSFGHWLTTSNVHATRAKGGYTFGQGNVLVGENGPEVVNLPGGSNVIPNGQLGSVSPVNWSGGGGANDRPILVQVMLDRKVLAEGVARANQDYAARR